MGNILSHFFNPLALYGLSWLHFNDKPRVQERQQVKEQQSCISIFVAYPTIPMGNILSYCFNPLALYGLSWLHFDDKSRVQERQQVKEQQSCISVFVAYPTIPSSS